MGIAITEGFDTYSTTNTFERMEERWWTKVEASVTVATGYQGRGLAVSLPETGDQIELPLLGSDIERTSAVSPIRTLGFRFRATGGTPSVIGNLLVFAFADDTVAQVKIDTDGFLQFGKTGTMVIFGSTNVCDGAWHYIEIVSDFKGTGGTNQVWVDESSEGTSTGNFRLGNSGPTSVEFWRSFTVSGEIYIDDLVLLDNQGDAPTSRIGAVQVVTLFPAGDNTTANWTTVGGSGDDADRINENPPDDDTTYLTSSTNAQQSLFTLDDPDVDTGSGGLVHAVVVVARARKEDASDVNLKVLVRDESDTTTGTSAKVGVIWSGSEYEYQEALFIENPDSTVAWTLADLDTGIYAGIELDGSGA